MARNNLAGPCLYSDSSRLEQYDDHSDFAEGDYFSACKVDYDFSAGQTHSQFDAQASVDIRVQLRSEELLNLLRSGLAGLYAVIRSPRAKCCHSVELASPVSDQSDETLLDAVYRVNLPVREMFLKNSLEIALIAKQDGIWLHKDRDYDETIQIHLTPGRVLAYDLTMPNLSVVRDPLETNIGSVFVMVEDKNLPEGTFDCRLSETDALEIKVSSDIHNKMVAFCRSKSHSNAFIATVVIPSLANVLSELYDEKTVNSDYESCRWYQVIDMHLTQALEVGIAGRQSKEALHDAQILLPELPKKFALKHRHG